MSENKTLSGRKIVKINLIPLATPFLIAAVAGAVFIALGVFFHSLFASIGMPLLCMLAYIGYTVRTNHDTPISVAGDSFYYLGFILTLFSLVVSLVSLAVMDDVSINTIVGSFGAALVTTIIGLVARLIVTSFSVQAKERRERVEEELERSINTFTAQLESLTTHTIASLATMHGEVKSTLDSTLELYADTTQGMTDKYQSSMETNLSVVEEAMNSLSDRVNSIDVSREMVSKPLGNSLNDVIEVIRTSQKGFEEVISSIDTSNKAISLQVNDSSHIISSHVKNLDQAFNKQVEQSAKAYQESMSSVTQTMSDLDKLTLSTNSQVDAKIGNLTSGIDKLVESLNTASKPIVSNLGFIDETQKNIQNSIKLLSGSNDHFKEVMNGSIDSINRFEVLNNELEKLTALIPNVKDNLRDMSYEAEKSTVSMKNSSDVVNETTHQVASDISTVYRNLASQIKTLKAELNG